MTVFIVTVVMVAIIKVTVVTIVIVTIVIVTVVKVTVVRVTVVIVTVVSVRMSVSVLNDFFPFFKKTGFLDILSPPQNHSSRWIKDLCLKGLSLILAYF